MKIIRYILFPVVPIYYLVTWLRNVFYDLGLKPSKSYNLPIICVGNLSVGGTGKTPMIEYLIRLLNPNFKTATLSRGYKRKTKGFILANTESTVLDLGDEPFQFHKKFDDILVSVDANRQHGISQLLNLKPTPQVILLDDAYQHRKVKAGFNILLTAFYDLYSNDIVLPTGNLREPRQGANRANIIVVTKCPKHLSDFEKQNIKASLKPKPHQDIFFSSINYSNTIKGFGEDLVFEDLKHKNLTVVTGIANSTPFINYLKDKNLVFEHLNFSDHHHFSQEELNELKGKECILTTEKDFVRLSPSIKENIYYLPITIEIDRPNEFNLLVTSFVENFK